MRHDDPIDKRCRELAEYLITNSATVRDTARHFGISKSTVHKDIREKLRYVNTHLYSEATRVLDKNKSERHIRGGIATKNKYLKLRKNRVE